MKKSFERLIIMSSTSCVVEKWQAVKAGGKKLMKIKKSKKQTAEEWNDEKMNF